MTAVRMQLIMLPSRWRSRYELENDIISSQPYLALNNTYIAWQLTTGHITLAGRPVTPGPVTPQPVTPGSYGRFHFISLIRSEARVEFSYVTRPGYTGLHLYIDNVLHTELLTLLTSFLEIRILNHMAR